LSAFDHEFGDGSVVALFHGSSGSWRLVATAGPGLIGNDPIRQHWQ
jgi:hypothetical protein